MQRDAAAGIDERHSGQSRIGVAGSPGLEVLELIFVTGTTTKKYMAAATKIKVMTLFMKSP